MVHKFSPAVRLSLNVGTAFRLPTPKDRYFNGQTPAGINIGNPDLKPGTQSQHRPGLEIPLPDGRPPSVSRDRSRPSSTGFAT